MVEEISYRLNWVETEEGWVLYGRALNQANRIVARAKFHLPYDTADTVETILGGSAKERAQKAIQELLEDTVQGLRKSGRL